MLQSTPSFNNVRLFPIEHTHPIIAMTFGHRSPSVNAMTTFPYLGKAN